MQFDGVAHITATKAKERFGAKSKRKQTSLLICYAEGFVFIVDATNKQLIAKIAGKVR